MRYSNALSGSPSRQPQPSFYGNYIGIVVQNNDPLRQGRVKVWVPHISQTIFNTFKDQNTDKKFRFMGDNIDSSLTSITEEVKKLLPWADVALPIASGGSSGKYDNYNKIASISDSNRVSTSTPDQANTTSKYSLNADGTGEKYGKLYEINELQPSDAFNRTFETNKGIISTGNPNRVNPYTHLYKPQTYSNCTKGQFAIPDVGAHVWVFFREGDALYPVVFASHYGIQDWAGVFQGYNNYPLDYPGDYNNVDKVESQGYSPDTETYRGKMLINQKGGTLEVINTDNKEAIRITAYNGSYQEMNNQASVELNTQNKQILTLKDHFNTIRGYKNEYTECDHDEIVRGDHFEKIGNFNKAAILDWKNIAEEIAAVKQLFEIQRCNPVQSYNDLFPYTSALQKQSGKAAPCPVCSSPNRPLVWDRRQTFLFYIPVNSTAVITATNPMQGNWTTAYDMVNDSSFSVFNVKGSGWLGQNIIRVGYNTASTLIQPPVIPSNFLGSGPCPVCNGTGISPSSQDGTWDTEDKKEQLKLKFEAKINQITEIEKQLGQGGSKIIQITKHQMESVGLVMNDLPNIRLDPYGKITNNEVIIAEQGVFVNQKASPVIEYVTVEDLPGGTYNLNVCNRWNVLVGSGGIALKSYGPVDIAGSIVNLTGEQVNIASDNEVNIKSKKRLCIESDILVLRQSEGKQVLVDSNFGVTQNMAIAGSAHIEGELTIQHITAPIEFQETEEVYLEGYVLPNVDYHGVLQCPGGDPCNFTLYFTEKIPVNVGRHSHQFRNLPLTLMSSADGVRTLGRENTSPAARTAAYPPNNEKKNAISIVNGVQVPLS